MESRICDYCYLRPEGPITPSGRFGTPEDARSALKVCSALCDTQHILLWLLQKCIDGLLWLFSAITGYLPGRLFTSQILSFLRAYNSGCKTCYYCLNVSLPLTLYPLLGAGVAQMLMICSLVNKRLFNIITSSNVPRTPSCLACLLRCERCLDFSTCMRTGCYRSNKDGH